MGITLGLYGGAKIIITPTIWKLGMAGILKTTGAAILT
jgi:hypothetical protein